jgi:uncharacterized membrane protein (DUF4010 family)
MAALAARRHGVDSDEGKEVKFHNPFDIWFVLGFALFLGAVILIGRAVSETFGATGALLGAMVAGVADADAVTVAMTRLVPQTLSPRSAAVAMLAAVAANTIGKIVVGAVIAGGRFAVEISLMALGCLAAGAVALWMTVSLLPA